MKDETIITLAAIIAVAIIECIALCLGYNGTIQKLSFAAICGLGGLMLPTPHLRR